MTQQHDIDTLLRAELEKLRKLNPTQAANLLAQALGRPIGRSQSSTTVGPALPQRTQHHSPLESESRFVRFAGWWNEWSCAACGHIDRSFDGLFEEREWIAGPNIGGPKHWLKAGVKPFPELLQDAVTYVRYYNRAFCYKCVGAESWPLAQSNTGEGK